MENLLNLTVAVSPGKMLSRILEARGWKQSDLAEVTGLSDKTISLIIKDKQAITPETAKILSDATGKSMEYWLNMYANYHLAKKNADDSKEKDIQSRALMHKYMPVAEMRKLGWFINDVSTCQGIENEYERIFGSRSLPVDKFENSTLPMVARQTRDDKELSKYYRTAWFSFARFHASAMLSLKPANLYDKSRLELIAKNLYMYTVKENGLELFLSDLYESGVNFFVLSHLPKTYLDGAAFLYEKNGVENPFIVYTARYDREDNFWFVIAHEIAHILLHYDFLSNPFFDDMDDFGSEHRTEMEMQADNKALESLRKDVVLACGKMMKSKYVTESMALRLEKSTGVGSAVALGMLQHEKIIPWNIASIFKPKIKARLPEMYIRG